MKFKECKELIGKGVQYIRCIDSHYHRYDKVGKIVAIDDINRIVIQTSKNRWVSIYPEHILSSRKLNFFERVGCFVVNKI